MSARTSTTSFPARQEIWNVSEQSLDHALQLVRRAQDIVGDNELLFVAEGLIYWQKVNVGMVPVSEYDECLRKAEVCAEKVFALNPDSSKGYGLRGAIRHIRADPSGAVLDYKQALLLDPNDPEALLWLGYYYAVSGRPALARALMDRLQHVDPLTSVNLIMWGMVAMFDGNTEGTHLDPARGRRRSGEPNATDDARDDAGGERSSRRGRGNTRSRRA